jgi:hypothetical protein
MIERGKETIEAVLWYILITYVQYGNNSLLEDTVC